MSKPLNRIQTVIKSMENLTGDRLIKAFVIEAMSVYAQFIQDEPAAWTPESIGQAAWEALAQECIETFQGLEEDPRATNE